MSKLKIHENGRNFILDGQNFFYLADTVWSAFTNATMEEWEFYLEKRWSQGYNVLQINTLPQWDRCLTDVNIYPFYTEDGQRYDFERWNEDYYTRARKMCKMAVDKGFQLSLVVLWLNYVPGTWGSKMVDINVMPKDFVRKYAEKVVTEFDEFDPIYLISGDTDFDTKEAVEYYEIALDTICEKSPESLKAVHVKRGYDYIPEQFLDRLSFYMYQSGHNADGQEMAYALAEHFYRNYPRKPIVNAEPCYEQMGYSRKRYGRFGPYDIRKAAWSGILSGACAGVTYGAHGVWNWKKTGKRQNPVLGEGFDESFPVQEAIHFPGAWDYGFIRDFLETRGIVELKPVNELLIDHSQEIRMAQTEDERYLIYIPYTTNLVIGRCLEGYHAKAIDLADGRTARVPVECENDRTLIHIHGFQNDALIILWK
ncbi:apiosidase-like domain-containing protein [Clostridium sp. Marseille-P2415]|uniref:apiosidase-like domain-containing protein n=1 Tax=Clostridium sp. Marseille-P2415 TaxID=1805471 RepID=UPI0009883A40|nr:DUF4038 domain-containing protein [Clostridium sp. Marseille-P2415]